MPNHVHLIAQVIETAQFPKFMQGILQTYAIYFRSKYASTGFIFQNRYKSLPIEDEVYLLECARYVERNPVRAELAVQAADYRWSSYQFYACGRKDPIVTRTNPLYDSLGQTADERRRRYAAFICEKRPYEDIVDQAFKIFRD
jgi:putative transposase